MSGRLVVGIMALGFIALAVGLFVPEIIDAKESEARDVVELSVNDTATYDQVVQFQLDAVNATDNSVNVTVTDLSTLSDARITNLSVDETKSVTPADEQVNVTLKSVEDADTARLQPSFSRTYGWNDGAALFIAEFDTIMSLTGFVMIIGGLGAMMKG